MRAKMTYSTGTVGKGKAVHAVFELGEHKGQTVCGKAATATGERADISQGDAFTCRSCWKAIPSWIGYTVEVEEEAPAKAEGEPRELDIWLTEGVVLIDPMLDQGRMIFQRWEGSKAVLLSETGVEHRVSQSYVTTWKYVPRPADFNQVWRSKETGDLVRIIDTAREAVRLRGMQPEDRPFWLSREMLAEHFAWAPEAAA